MDALFTCERCAQPYPVEFVSLSWVGDCDCTADWTGPQWQYLEKTNIDSADLARIGSLGWELVAVTETTTKVPADPYDGGPPEVISSVSYYFKRPVRPS